MCHAKGEKVLSFEKPEQPCWFLLGEYLRDFRTMLFRVLVFSVVRNGAYSKARRSVRTFENPRA